MAKAKTAGRETAIYKLVNTYITLQFMLCMQNGKAKRKNHCGTSPSRAMKAQFSFEFLVILAVVTLIVGAGILLTQQSLLNTEKAKQDNQAHDSLENIAATAREVYAQGEGARKKIYVSMPPSYDIASSYVRNRTIGIRSGTTDYASNLNFDVRGSLPQTKGNVFLWVTNEGNRVRIGDAMFTLSKYSVSAIMRNNNTKIDGIAATNVFGSGINLSVTTYWPYSDVVLTVVPLTASNLADLQSAGINLTFVASENATGFYSGRMDINGSRGNVSEVVSVPISIEVSYVINVKSPPLTITPNLWNQSLMPDQSASKSFQVCTNVLTTVPYVKFTTSLGAPGAWVGSLEDLPGMSPETCQSKVLNLTVPSSTVAGNYSGYITANGGIPGAQDSVALLVEVGGNITDIWGPLINYSLKTPVRSFYLDTILITVKGDDTTTGNSSIKFCEIQMDNGSWTNMNPSDGMYSGPIEFAYSTYNGLNVSGHNVTMRCIDKYNNVGPEASLGFRVIKGMMFIKRDTGAFTQTEQDWVNWITSHTSATGLKWQYDVVSRQDMSSGIVDKRNYASMLMAEDDFQGALGATLVTHINQFVTSGGYVGFLDIAAAKGLVATSLGANARTIDHNHIHINNSNHYITSPYSTNGTGILYIYTPYTANQWVIDSISYQGYFLAATYAVIDPFMAVVMGDAINHSNIVSWGATRPYRFNSNGNEITGRVFDYLINVSSIG